MASSGGGSALKWRPLVAVVQNGGGVSCRVFLQRNGNSSRRPPVCRLRGGKAGFHRVLQQSFLINKTPRPRGIIFTPVKTSVFAVTSTNGDLIHRDFIGLSLGKKNQGWVSDLFQQPEGKKKVLLARLWVLSCVFGQTLFPRRVLFKKIRQTECFWL